MLITKYRRELSGRGRHYTTLISHMFALTNHHNFFHLSIEIISRQFDFKAKLFYLIINVGGQVKFFTMFK